VIRVPSYTIVLGAAAVLLVARHVRAQQPTAPNPEQMQQMMGPMMAQMATVMLEATFTALAKPENTERLADFTKHYYDALIKRGFTKEEALQIVVGTGIPHPMTPGR
jgi:hypothetical protein